MKFSGIGGQAVLEGIMMRNGKKYAVAVRKSDGDIAVEVHESHSPLEKHAWMRVPVIRGVVSFVFSLKVGLETLMASSKYFEEGVDAEIEAEKAKKAEAEGKPVRELTAEEQAKKAKKDKQKENLMLGCSLVLSFALAIGLFSFLPVLVASPIKLLTDSYFVLALVEGLVRVGIFVLYVWAISLMKDIKRTYMYHGAEHKCINCVEHGLLLTVDNVRSSSKEHKRCGTSFLLIVMVMSVFIFMFIRVDGLLLRLLSRLLMIPVIAGLSFEFLQFAGKSDSCVMNALSRPGMWLQGLTTKEPDDSMIEVAIKAVEAVFDWREFLGLPPEVKEESTEADMSNAADGHEAEASEAEESAGAESSEEAESADAAAESAGDEACEENETVGDEPAAAEPESPEEQA